LFWLESKLRISDSVKINVLVVLDEDSKKLGTVHAENNQELNIILNAKYYNLKDNLNPITKRYNDWFTTAAHEMVHARQWSTYQLIYSGSFYWEEKKFHSVNDSILYDDYIRLPWEEEAFLLQDELYNEWLALGQPINTKRNRYGY
jgi:hypothetical protein